jgi:hypothetical protein
MNTNDQTLSSVLSASIRETLRARSEARAKAKHALASLLTLAAERYAKLQPKENMPELPPNLRHPMHWAEWYAINFALLGVPIDAELLRRAKSAHSFYEQKMGEDKDWADWYAEYILDVLS